MSSDDAGRPTAARAEGRVRTLLPDLTGYAWVAGVVGLLCWVGVLLTLRDSGGTGDDRYRLHTWLTVVLVAVAGFATALCAALIAGRLVVRALLVVRDADRAWRDAG